MSETYFIPKKEFAFDYGWAAFHDRRRQLGPPRMFQAIALSDMPDHARTTVEGGYQVDCDYQLARVRTDWQSEDLRDLQDASWHRG